MLKKSMIMLVAAALLFSLTVGVAAERPRYDFGGATVTIAGITPDYQGHLGLPWKYSPIRIEMAEEYLEWVEEQFNVNIEWQHGFPGMGIAQGIVSQMMAGDAPDLAYGWSEELVSVAAEQLFMPLNEAKIKNIPDFLANPLDSYSEFMGQHYLFAATWPGGIGTGVFWNKSLFEREGMASPYDLYEAGEWTWEAMRELAIQATRDTTGDGEIDQWGVSEWANEWDWRFPIWFLGSNNANVYRIEEGRPVFTLDEKEGVEAYEYIHSLFQDGVVGGHHEFWSEQRVAMQTVNPSAMNHINPLENWHDEIGLVPFPMGPSGTRPNAPFTHVTAWGVTIATEHDPDALVELMFALELYTDDYLNVPPFVTTNWENLIQEEMDSYALMVSDRETIEYYRWIHENIEYFTDHYPAFFPDFPAMNRSIREGTPPSVAIGEIRAKTEAHLLEVFGF